MIRPRLKPGTWNRYELAVRLHIAPAIGKVKLARLDAATIQRLYSQKLKEGLAPSTVTHMHSVLHGALKVALRLGLVARNVSELVTAPRGRAKEMHTLDPQQARQLLQAARGERLEAIYVLALTTGMRLGELLALQWKDLDLEHGHLMVRHTLYHGKAGAWRLLEPKTASSRRKIHLAPMAQQALRDHRVRQQEEKDFLREAWADHDLVFARADGEAIRTVHMLERGLLPLLKRADLPVIRFHDLRHTCATLLLLQGANVKVVSELLGHADISITLRIYAHVLPTMSQDLAATMERLLASGTDSLS